MSDIDSLLSRGLRTGMEAAKEAASSGASSRLVDFFSVKPDQIVYVRFLTEASQAISFMSHPAYPTRPAPKDYTGHWPKAVSAICRRSKLGDDKPMFDDCYCCEHPQMQDGRARNAISRQFGLVVIREEVISDGVNEKFRGPDGNIIPSGQRTGLYRTKKKEYQAFENGQPSGAVQLVPDVQLVEYGYTNFWAELDAIYKIYGTIMNQEIAIMRTGSTMNDTKYRVQGMGPSAVDFRNPAVLAKFGVQIGNQIDPRTGTLEWIWPPQYDLRRLLYERASSDYYARFIDPTKPFPGTVGSAAQGAVETVKSAATEATQASLAALRERIAVRTGDGQPAPVAPVPAPVAASPAPVAQAPTEPPQAAPVAPAVPVAPVATQVQSDPDEG